MGIKRYNASAELKRDPTDKYAKCVKSKTDSGMSQVLAQNACKKLKAGELKRDKGDTAK